MSQWGTVGWTTLEVSNCRLSNCHSEQLSGGKLSQWATVGQQLPGKQLSSEHHAHDDARNTENVGQSKSKCLSFSIDWRGTKRKKACISLHVIVATVSIANLWFESLNFVTGDLSLKPFISLSVLYVAYDLSLLLSQLMDPNTFWWNWSERVWKSFLCIIIGLSTYGLRKQFCMPFTARVAFIWYT